MFRGHLDLMHHDFGRVNAWIRASGSVTLNISSPTAASTKLASSSGASPDARTTSAAQAGRLRHHPRGGARGVPGGLVGGAHVVDPDRARVVVAAATQSMLDAIHTLGLVMAVVPIAAIVAAMMLIKHKAAR